MDPIPLRFVGRELPRLQGSGFRASRVRLNDEKKNCPYCHIRLVKITPWICDNVKIHRTKKIYKKWKLISEQNYRINKKNTKGRIAFTY